VKLSDLARRLDLRLEGDGELEVTGITHDSRLVRAGWVFAAVPGQHRHGLDFLPEAVARGARAVLTERAVPSPVALPRLVSAAPRRAMALVAWALAGDPQRELTLIGVTGTNGKTTTVNLIGRIFAAAGRPAGCFGTLGYELPCETVEAARTTPEATDLAPLLRRLLDQGGRVAAMEVSSHSLVLDRVAGLEFQIAVWTNLTRDHLDFHADMEDYFNAKRRLFDVHLAAGGRRVLPAEEPCGQRLLAEPRPGDLSWGERSGDVRAEAVVATLDGTRFVLVLPEGREPVDLPLVGGHNLRNALAAAAVAHGLGVPAAAIRQGLEGARPLPGRLEPVPTDLPFPVLVDYAHTPEGLRAVLAALREVTARRLIVVFGAGGDRDRGKRGPMGEAVGSLADRVVVTSDNPRSEDPLVIAEAVAVGVRAAGGHPEVVLDRRAAIARALQLADRDSLVVVAGKGHERAQLVGERRIPFSDLEVVRELAAGIGGTG
jgi:UDP-N-acetylmuramoyl-L-alanyl-D-glutamate--2,6-diaminopimelate ligase